MYISNPAIDAMTIGNQSGLGTPAHVETKKIASIANPVTHASTDKRSI
jgi:hypothetical protein